ncbi:hypothetical protein TL16_g13182 [Triparma laevis f. inornata]|uniref:Uncharacterized protein n=1 Tax=Triparma laevis f. inornata TaxID=1714386 RepID=A0A9W7BXQ8_9STRA|nr:hypothetical protein TL16_g13182 [Triparma laevis f. inornata]
MIYVTAALRTVTFSPFRSARAGCLENVYTKNPHWYISQCSALKFHLGLRIVKIQILKYAMLSFETNPAKVNRVLKVKNGEDYKPIIDYTRNVLIQLLTSNSGGLINDFSRFYITLNPLHTCELGMNLLKMGDGNGGDIVMKCLIKEPRKFVEHWGLLIGRWRELKGVWERDVGEVIKIGQGLCRVANNMPENIIENSFTEICDVVVDQITTGASGGGKVIKVILKGFRSQ